MLYILNLVCLLLKYKKKRCVAHIQTSYVYYRNEEKTGMLYILKLVCLLLKYKKIGYVVNIKTSMFSTEKTAMLSIRNHKISEPSVELIARCQSKLLHLDVIYLSSAGANVFVRNCPGLASRRGPLRGTG